MSDKDTAGVSIRAFRLSDYDRVMELWAEGGLPLKPLGRDSRESIARQLARTHVHFLVAEAGEGGRARGSSARDEPGRSGSPRGASAQRSRAGR